MEGKNRMRVMAAALCLLLGTALTTAAQTVSEGDTSTQSGLMPEPTIMKSAVALAGQWLGESGPVHRDGFYPDFGNMVTGAGWISAGPGYRTHLFDGRAFVDGSAAISWRAYKMAQARFEVTDLAAHRLTVGSQIRWQDLTQMNYFGTGGNSIEAGHSQYRFKDTDIVGYGIYLARDRRHVRVASAADALFSDRAVSRQSSGCAADVFTGPGDGQSTQFPSRLRVGRGRHT
jgi:hypothetical protein